MSRETVIANAYLEFDEGDLCGDTKNISRRIARRVVRRLTEHGYRIVLQSKRPTPFRSEP